MRRRVVLLFAGSLAAGCVAVRPSRLGADYALVTGGLIWTEAGAAKVEALLIEDGRVLAVGTQAEVEARMAEIVARARRSHSEIEPRRIDLAGGTAVPGLVDAHGHLEGLGEALENVDLLGCRDLLELVERVAERAAAKPPGTWILGRGWDQTLFPGQEFPEHAALSARVSDHPVFLERVDGHAAFVNARALELAGLDGALPAVEGGRIVVGEDGRPTGVLVDAAATLVWTRIPPPDRTARARRILAAQAALLAWGLTGMHDMGTAPETLAVLQELECDGRLKLRVASYLWANEGALAGFTTGAAFAAHEEERRGKLLPGFAADLSVLSVDPIDCEPRALLDAKVLATIVDGELVFSALPSRSPTN